MSDADMMPLLTAIAAAVACAGIAFAIAYPILSGDRQREKRFSTVTESRASKLQVRSAADAAATRRKQVADSLKEIDQRNKNRERVTLRVLLTQAGLSADPKSYWIASAVSGTIFALIAANAFSNSSMLPFLMAISGFVGAFGLPRLVLKKMIERRMAKFLKELPNAIDVVVRGIKSGLPLSDCIGVIASEAPAPVGPEFKEVMDQQRIGLSLPEALDRMSTRVPLQETKFFSMVVAIQQQAGGNLAEALSNLSSVLRDRSRMEIKIKALSSEAKASAMILGSLPPGIMGMLSVTSPEYVYPLIGTQTGNLFIMGGLVWMGFGVLVMRKMINFKF